MKAPRVLVVDDEAANRGLLRDLLSPLGYQIEEAVDGEDAIAKFLAKPPDLMLLDVMMPKVHGYEVLEYVKKNPKTRLIPVIMLTGIADLPERIRALELGVDEFIAKPFNAVELQTRVRSLLSLKRLIDDMEEVGTLIEGIANMVEARDAYTGDHGKRLGSLAVKVGRAVGIKEDGLQILSMGGIAHDIGKIAVADAILNKPGKLDDSEWLAMRKHPLVGAEMLLPMRSLDRIMPLVRHHHEKLDGSGYPDKLRGTEIPLPVRIVSVVDVYDALATKRSYKESWPIERCLNTLREEAERGWWDREVVEVLATIVESE